MAAAAASEEDLRIPQTFEEYTYTTWKDYVLECVQKNIPIESPKIETLALLTLLCHKFTKGNRNYEKLFFELLCQALASSEDSLYRCRSRERRPQMFRDKPTAQVRNDYRFVWPVTLRNHHDVAKTSPTCYVGIPSQEDAKQTQKNAKETQKDAKETQEDAKETQKDAKETQKDAKQTQDAKETQKDAKETQKDAKETQKDAKETQDARETESLCAILYLVMPDMAASFRKSLLNRSESSVEFPCLLNYFKMSPLNNQKQLPALVGEYLAFINISLECNFDQSWEFKPVEKHNDFQVEKDNELKLFSVKSDNSDGRLRYFKDSIKDPSSASSSKKKDPPTNSLILILNCDCDQCKLNPVVALQDTETVDENCKQSKAGRILEDLFSSLGDGTHYVTSAPIYFDLRFAMDSCYKFGEEASLAREEEKRRRQDREPPVKKGRKERKKGRKKRKGNITSKSTLYHLFRTCSIALSSDKSCLKWI